MKKLVLGTIAVGGLAMVMVLVYKSNNHLSEKSNQSLINSEQSSQTLSGDDKSASTVEIEAVDELGIRLHAASTYDSTAVLEIDAEGIKVARLGDEVGPSRYIVRQIMSNQVVLKDPNSEAMYLVHLNADGKGSLVQKISSTPPVNASAVLVPILER